MDAAISVVPAGLARDRPSDSLYIHKARATAAAAAATCVPAATLCVLGACSRANGNVHKKGTGL